MQTASLLLGSNEAGVRVAVDARGSERWSAKCDEGLPKSELLSRAPPEGMLEDFRSWEDWETVSEKWWASAEDDNWERREAFIRMALDRPEDRVVFVGHGAMWGQVLGHYLDNCEIMYCDRSPW